MKPTYVAAMILIAGAIALFIWNGSNVDTYSNFTQAAENPDKSVQVICDLAKDKAITYDPHQDANYFTFYANDRGDDTKAVKVIYYGAKPQDFELSEGIVLTGKMDGEDFVASDILLKCPSKYKDEEILVRDQQKS